MERQVRNAGSYTLEAYSPYPKGLPSFSDESLSVEHIMPQKLSTQWKLYLTKETMAQYEASLHRLGNLALTNYNGEMSNKDFKDKKVIYKDSKFYYTTRIVEYDKWQIQEIDDRSKKLAAEALKIWSLPAKYQKVKAVSESLHTLGEDTAQFTYTKPSLLLIGNEEYSVNYWADILPILCKVLEKDNHYAFVRIANSEKIAAFGIEDDTHVYSTKDVFVHIVDKIYVRAFMSAASVLETMSKIVTDYDKLAETDFFGNIMFSLK